MARAVKKTSNQNKKINYYYYYYYYYYYCLQQSCCKVIFSQGSVSHSVHEGECLAETNWTDTPDRHPPWQTRHLGRHPPDKHPHHPLPRWPLQRMVCILLECFLVIIIIMHTPIYVDTHTSCLYLFLFQRILLSYKTVLSCFFFLFLTQEVVYPFCWVFHIFHLNMQKLWVWAPQKVKFEYAISM